MPEREIINPTTVQLIPQWLVRSVEKKETQALPHMNEELELPSLTSQVSVLGHSFDFHVKI